MPVQFSEVKLPNSLKRRLWNLLTLLFSRCILTSKSIFEVMDNTYVGKISLVVCKLPFNFDVLTFGARYEKSLRLRQEYKRQQQPFFNLV